MDKPNCYECKYMATIPGNCHIRCEHPKVHNNDPMMELIGLLCTGGPSTRAMKELGVNGDSHGIMKGWFMWPLNYDPTWLLSCNGFEPQMER